MSKRKLAGSLMIQGCTSDAGKSTVVTALCRILYRQGISVAPFKPQNMALNSAVTKDGGEIGRAQALQAMACGLEPETLFNPVLIKPSSDQTAQVIINGRAISQLEAAQFGSIKELAFDHVMDAYHTLKRRFDVILIEGAGSPAEINLRANDIANMGFAEAADTPVILVGDIDKGGVFAHLTGTQNLLSKSEQQRIKGFLINRFRGNLDLLQDGLNWLKTNTGKPVLGVLPYIQALKLDAEDAIHPNQNKKHSPQEQTYSIKVKVPALSRISNHTDFDPLIHHSQVNFEFVGPGSRLQGADLIILPGTKNVRADIQFLREHGWDQDIFRHLRYGGKLLGICGGFQMLGQHIDDPQGMEDQPGCSAGLGLLELNTRLEAKKQLKQVSGVLTEYAYSAGLQGKISQGARETNASANETLRAYEIHCGISHGTALDRPFASLRDQLGLRYTDGAVSHDGQVIGSYLHGLFETAESVRWLFDWVSSATDSIPEHHPKQSVIANGTHHQRPPEFDRYIAHDWQETRESEIDRLADIVTQHADIEQLQSLICP